MDHRIVHPFSSESLVTSAQDRSNAEAPAPAASHPVLSRLMEEVRNELHVEARYDRVHHRHNRGR